MKLLLMALLFPLISAIALAEDSATPATALSEPTSNPPNVDTNPADPTAPDHTQDSQDSRNSQTEVHSDANLDTVSEASDDRDYSLLLKRNIFSATRRVKPTETPRPQPETPPAPRDPRSDWVFCGVILHGAAITAIVEERSTGRTMTVAVGGELLAEKVESITLDRLVLRSTDETARAIEIGQSLTGEASTLPAPQAHGSPQSTARSRSRSNRSTQREERTTSSDNNETPSATPPADATSIIEQMRRRRQQQMGGGQ